MGDAGGAEAHALGGRSAGQLHGYVGPFLGERHNDGPDGWQVVLVLRVAEAKEAWYLVPPPVSVFSLYGAEGVGAGVASGGAWRNACDGACLERGRGGGGTIV